MKIRKFNRYPLSNTFMFIGLIIAFIAVICGSSIYTRIEMENKEIKNFRYNNEAVVNFYSQSEESLNLSDIATSKDINVEITLFAMSVGKYTRVVDIAYSYNEEPSYILKSGTLPSKEDINNGRRVVNVGEDLLEDVYVKGDTEYIKFDGIEYEVIGYFGSENSDVLDSIIYFVYECLDPYHKEILSNQDMLDLRFGSNYNDAIEEVSALFGNIPPNVEYSFEDAENFSNMISNDHEKDMYFFMVYAFAICICIIISELWICERMDEIAILKTVGLSIKNIVNRLYASILGIMCLALLISYIAVFAFYRVTGNEVVNMSGFVLVAVIMILSSVLVLLVPILKIKTIEPAKCINSRGNY